MVRAATVIQLASVVFSMARVLEAGCPFLARKKANDGIDAGGERALQSTRFEDADYSWSDGEADFSAKTYRELQADITNLLTNSRDFWPADFGNYGPLMIRLAWHCAGTYRRSDGRGGCDGGRTRFNPERSWADNTNLDKALTLLEPIKLKYGGAVTWGDLIALTGNVAIGSMGGPVLGFCAGRQEDDSGYASLELGPTDEQRSVAPCAVNGTCQEPLGPSTLGLIYVNPEGPLGIPNPAASVANIRDVFARMSMNDSETVALIGGGHAFGKFHGACQTGPGADPMDAPEDPWPGTCGDPTFPDFGRGEYTFTAGFEGQWTEDPTVWDNSFFTNLLEYDWEVSIGPGGHNQWHPTLKSDSNKATVPDIAMLTTDVALLMDPDYLALVELYATDQAALEHSFSNAWYKLTTRDMGPYSRCAGTDIPPPQAFQLPLPHSSTLHPPYVEAIAAIKEIIPSQQPGIAPDTYNGGTSYAALFVSLAWQCASTFRSTDYMGGCNGARIRFSPQRDWADNIGLNLVLGLLEPVKTVYPEISYADLIVMAGNVALGQGASLDLPFCSGRVDATGGDELISVLQPREYDDVIVGLRDRMKIMGLSVSQMVALAGRPRSPSQMIRLGFSGSYTADPVAVSNNFFKILLTETWKEVEGSRGAEYEAVGNPGVYALEADLALLWDPEFKAQAMKFAGDNDDFFQEFASAWTNVMNADRFNGPTGNACDVQVSMY